MRQAAAAAGGRSAAMGSSVWAVWALCGAMLIATTVVDAAHHIVCVGGGMCFEHSAARRAALCALDKHAAAAGVVRLAWHSPSTAPPPALFCVTAKPCGWRWPHWFALCCMRRVVRPRLVPDALHRRYDGGVRTPGWDNTTLTGHLRVPLLGSVHIGGTGGTFLRDDGGGAYVYASPNAGPGRCARGSVMSCTTPSSDGPHSNARPCALLCTVPSEQHRGSCACGSTRRDCLRAARPRAGLGAVRSRHALA